MRPLRDWHIAAWTLRGSPRLAAKARQLIAAPANAIFVSAVGVLEIATKPALGDPKDFPLSRQTAIGQFTTAGYHRLDIKADHAAGVATLPKLYGDPFNRLLVAQATSEPMYLMTADRHLLGRRTTVIPC